MRVQTLNFEIKFLIAFKGTADPMPIPGNGVVQLVSLVCRVQNRRVSEYDQQERQHVFAADRSNFAPILKGRFKRGEFLSVR